MSNRSETVNIVQLFFEKAQQYPGKTAISSKRGEITYAELAEEVHTYAEYLTEQGVGSGDRVMIFVPASAELYKVVLAVIKIGSVAVFLDQWSDYKRLKESAKLADCKALIAERKLRYLSYVLPVFHKIPMKLPPSGSGRHLRQDLTEIAKEDAALITFTTGSTSQPKAAKRTHGFLFQQLKALQLEIPTLKNDVCLSNLPIFTLSHLAEGSASVIPDYNPRKSGNMNPSVIFSQMEKQGVKTLISSPDFLLRLAGWAEGNSKHLGLQRIFTGGAPVFPDQGEVIRKAFPGVEVVIAYGSTEAEPISSLSLDELISNKALKSGGLPVGKAHPSAQVKVLRLKDEVFQPSKEEFEENLCDMDEIGEIIVSGPHVLKEYFKNEEAQEMQKFGVDGKLWHRTGDSGFVDHRGNLYLTGPCKRLIRTPEGYLSPFLMEYRLRLLPSVAEGTLIMQHGQMVLFLVKEKGAAAKEVKCDVQSARIPFERMVFLKKLPKDPRHNSKVDYQKLAYSS